MKFLFSIFLLLALSSTLAQRTLNIYGGINRDVYLGCLNCDNNNSNSIWNVKGTYGSTYNTNSIWNANGIYGDATSSTSAFNPTASDPPVIMGKNGFMGYFTINQYKTQRAGGQLISAIYTYYAQIRTDVGRWYERLCK